VIKIIYINDSNNNIMNVLQQIIIHTTFYDVLKYFIFCTIQTVFLTGLITFILWSTAN